MKMTWSEKDFRSDARRYGKMAIQYIANAIGFQLEADKWRTLEQETGVDAGNSAFWQRRALELERNAAQYAALAARAARRSKENQ